MPHKVDYQKLTKLFHISGFAGAGKKSDYSSTELPMLTSSTVSLFNKRLCFHCHERPLPVQEAGSNYAFVGYRCTCEGAINEMAERVAIDYLDLSGVNAPTLTLQEKTLQKLVKTIPCRDLRDLTDRNNGVVTQGQVNAGKFMHNNERQLTDKYYAFLPVYDFGQLIQRYCQQLLEKYEQDREKERAAARERVAVFDCKKEDVA